MTRNKIECPECKRMISKSNFNRHLEACRKTKAPVKIRGIDYDPNAGYKDGSRVAWNKGKTKETDERVQKYADSLSKNGKLSGYCSSNYIGSPEHLEASARGGFNKTQSSKTGSGKRFYVNDSFGKETCLQSSYEKICADILDKLNIRWTRPSYLIYVIDDKTRKYFPDFYLIDHKIYLDPKNDYLIKLDAEKIKAVISQNNVKVYILSKSMLTEKSIASLAQW